MQASTIATSLRDYLRILFHRKWYIAFFTLSSLAGFVVYAWFIAPVRYQAGNAMEVYDHNKDPLLPREKVSPTRNRMNQVFGRLQSSNGVLELLAGVDQLAPEFAESPLFQRLRAAYLMERRTRAQAKIEVATGTINKTLQISKTLREKLKLKPAASSPEIERLEARLGQARSQRKQAHNELVRIDRELTMLSDRVRVRNDAKGTPVAYRPGADPNDRRFERLGREVKEGLSISMRGNTIQVRAKHEEPALAVLLVDRAIEQIKMVHQRIVNEEVYRATARLDRQLEQARAKLTDQRRRQAQYEEEINEKYEIEFRPVYRKTPATAATGLDPQPDVPQGGNATQQAQEQIYTLKSQAKEINGEIMALERGIEELETQLANLPPRIARSERQVSILVQRLEARLATLMEEEAEAAINKTDTHPELILLRRQIRLIQERLQDAKTSNRNSTWTIPNPRIDELREEISGKKVSLNELRGKLESITKLVGRYKQIGSDLPVIMQRREGFVEAIANIQEGIRKDSKLRHDAMTSRGILNSGGGVQFKVREATEKPLKPSEPKKGLLVFLGFIIGLFFSAAAVFFVEYADHSIKGIEDVRRFLGLPVLGVIPDYEMYSNTRRTWLFKIIGNTTMKRIALIVLLMFAILLGAWRILADHRPSLSDTTPLYESEGTDPDLEPALPAIDPLVEQPEEDKDGLSMLNRTAKTDADPPAETNPPAGTKTNSTKGTDATPDDPAGPPPMPSME